MYQRREGWATRKFNCASLGSAKGCATRQHENGDLQVVFEETQPLRQSLDAGALYKHSRATKLKNPHPIVLTGTKPKRAGWPILRDVDSCEGWGVDA
jgi:hypothetical protein